METANIWNFSKSKRHNFIKICSIVPKTKLDLDILIHVTSLYAKFHFRICNLCKENEQELLVSRLSDQQTDSSKMPSLPLRKGGGANFFYYYYLTNSLYTIDDKTFEVAIIFGRFIYLYLPHRQTFDSIEIIIS